MLGIYIIKNTDNGKVYIGQSKDLSHRKSSHFYDLRNNKHHNELLQRDYNENPQAFTFEVLCTCKECDLDMLEKAYIEQYKSNNAEYGYNLENGGIINHDCAESTRQKRSELAKGNKRMCGKRLSDEWKQHLADAQPHRKKIQCVETGVVYDSFADAARKTGLNRTKIVSVCTGKRKSTGGLHFRYYG